MKTPIERAEKPIEKIKAEVLKSIKINEQLEENESRFQTTFNLASIGIAHVAPDGSFLLVNPKFCDIVGYSYTELQGLTFQDITHPDDLDVDLEYVHKMLTGEIQTYSIEKRYIRKDNSHVWINLTVSLVRKFSGEPEYFIFVIQDISERKQAFEKICEQAALLEVSSDAIIVRDLEGNVRYWNSGAEYLYGWQAAEIIGKNSNELLDFEKISQLEEAFRTVVQQGKWQGELNKVTKSRLELIVQSRWTLMRDQVGQPKSILTVDTDITEKKQLETQFFHAQRLESLATLASGIAHDLNNILTPILAAAQLLSLKLPNLDQQNQQLLQTIEDNSKRGAKTVKQILSFVRVDEGDRVILQPKHLLNEIGQVVKSTFPKSIEIQTEIPQNLWSVSVESTQIHQVLMNLCVNARDAMPQGGVLIIRAKNFSVDQNYASLNIEAKVGEYVVLTVSDTGCGISKKVSERIFEPFFTTKEVGKGTGLGLSTVIGIVKNHGGFVNVDSKVGKGSQFQVYLPASKQIPTQQNHQLEIFRGNGELILVVDDEVSVCEISKTLLEQHNYKVLTAKDGIEAISLCAAHPNDINIVLTDIQMPSMSGLNAIPIIQQINPSVKIIATSGLASNRNFLEANGISVQAFVLKPYTLRDLLNIIKDVLSAPM